MVTKISGNRRELACVPSSESVRNRLSALSGEARKLKILLRAAEQLEREGLRLEQKEGRR
jgi:hypothetical protein